MDFKAKLIAIEQGVNEVVLNAQEASELGWDLSDRVVVTANGRPETALVDHAEGMVKRGEIGLFDELAKALGVKDGDIISAEKAPLPASLDYIRKKLDGEILGEKEIATIISDVMSQKLSNAELASFVSAIYANGMTTDETAFLTKVIIESGDILEPPVHPVASEHSIGGVAGGRSSMILVPIISSLGICVPKTASRAISSACATADAMEVLAPVSLSLEKIKQVLLKANACIVWGGAVNIAAADDKLIQIRRPLRLDPQALLVSSILAKKKAEGAQFVVFDIPVGRGAKVPNLDKGRELARSFEVLAAKIGIKVVSTLTDGSEPLLSTIGPALEARAVLEILRSNGKTNETALLEKACMASGVLLQAIRGVSREEGYNLARHQVESGRAYEKMRQIIAAQGGNPDLKPEDIEIGKFRKSIFSEVRGRVAHIDNPAISRIVRALGAPRDKKAGMILKVKKGTVVEQGEELFQLVASTEENLARGFETAKRVPLIESERIVLEVV